MSAAVDQPVAGQRERASARREDEREGRQGVGFPATVTRKLGCVSGSSSPVIKIELSNKRSTDKVNRGQLRARAEARRKIPVNAPLIVRVCGSYQ